MVPEIRLRTMHFLSVILHVTSRIVRDLRYRTDRLYQGKDFADLEPGEFIGSATRANVSYFKVKLEMYDDRNEEPLPDVRVLEPGELGRNFARILEEVRELFPCE